MAIFARVLFIGWILYISPINITFCNAFLIHWFLSHDKRIVLKRLSGRTLADAGSQVAIVFSVSSYALAAPADLYHLDMIVYR